MDKRGSGILLHVSSLPSVYGIGDFGPGAYAFVDFLASAKQSFWQILPLNPTDPAHFHSPYSSTSAFAGNVLFISPDFLQKRGWLKKNEVKDLPLFSPERVEFGRVVPFKQKLFETAFKRFKADAAYDKFCRQNQHWIDDFALFAILKEKYPGLLWTRWPKNLKDREPRALKKIADRFSKEIHFIKFLQYCFCEQWFLLKDYCRKKGVNIIGDVPIYVDFHSVDVWKHPQFFKLKENRLPKFVAGVPPDYFSATGQRWGNPVYDWGALKKDKFHWWVERFKHNLHLFDFVRIDHFRGFAGFWQIPVSSKTAVKGRWVKGPGQDFFRVLNKRIDKAAIIAEDIGHITHDVIELIEAFGFPGMRILQFAFDGNPDNLHLPHHHPQNALVYTGTHDNNTIRGWFFGEARESEKCHLKQYLGSDVPLDDFHWVMIHLAMSSVADLAIIPLQDVLGLGEEARLNVPATRHDNWQWRFLPGSLTKTMTKRLTDLTVMTSRAE